MGYTSKRLKGIEPIIAVVILVAVTLVIAIAVVGWIMGWWSSLMGGQEMIRIMSVSYDNSTNTITIEIRNEGTGRAQINKVEILGVSVDDSGCKNKTVGPGATMTCEVTASLTPGVRYTIRVYTSAGNQATFVFTA